MKIYIVYQRICFEWVMDRIFTTNESAENYINDGVLKGVAVLGEYVVEEYNVYD